MELDQLKTAWQTTSAQLDEMRVAQSAMRQTIRLNQSQGTLNRLRIGPVADLLIAAFVLMIAGNFIADRFASLLKAPIAVLPCLGLYAVGIATIWTSVRQFIIIAALDYAAPALETQRKLAELRTLKVRSTQVLLLAGIPLWIIFPLFTGQLIFGVNFVFAIDRTWLISNIVLGLAVSGVTLWAAHRYADSSRFWQGVNDVFAGTEIKRAEAMIRQIEEFEQP